MKGIAEGSTPNRRRDEVCVLHDQLISISEQTKEAYATARMLGRADIAEKLAQHGMSIAQLLAVVLRGELPRVS